MDREVAFVLQIVGPKERGELTRGLSGAQPLIPIKYFIFGMARNQNGTAKSFPVVPLDHAPRTGNGVIGIIEFLQALEGKGDDPIGPLQDRARA